MNLTAKDIMTDQVVWVQDDMSVSEAVDLFVEERISGAPVVDESGTLTGVVSLRDFLRSGEEADEVASVEEQRAIYNEPWDLPLSKEDLSSFHVVGRRDLLVKEIMTPIVFNADIRTPIIELAETMLRGRIHRVVVLDGNELAGIVTSMDMLKAIVKMGEAR